VKTFTIEAADGIDAVEKTDGVDVTTRDLGANFPRGLVVQHGSDDGGTTNFKPVSLVP
jgi:myo-inositol-hexaphosphate 3-phosphohydrolase